MNKGITISVIALVLSVMLSCATNRQEMGMLPEGDIMAEKTIDMRGKTITTYILYDTVSALREMETGQTLEVATDDFPPLGEDIRAWSRMTGNRILHVSEEKGIRRFIIEKGAADSGDKKMTLVLSSDQMLNVLSPLGFALGAAVSGMDVSLYFQGPGVHLLKKGFKEKLPGLQKPFSSLARNGLSDAGHVPPQEKIRQLIELGAKIYICGPSMKQFGVTSNEIAFSGVIQAEYVTFIEKMKDADIQIYQ